ncbi:syntaxin-4 [Malaclemys terrapin pileata]|uniref:syntaxin-4 n=1 Tax=Malaclemys terrapin pileata TaxID=2991368 RepID=UPI0023A83D0D|nr:syntaxin-4 [Malaclemys terrapin pileata]
MTMRDRTQELREDDGSSDSEEAERMVLVVKPGSAKFKDEGEPEDEFFQTARGIREALKTLEGKVKDLEKHQTTILATPLPEDSMKRDLQRLREEIKDLAKDIRSRLKTIEPKKGEEDENRNAINTRMKRTQHGILSQQFLELINKCNSIQSQYRDRNVERIHRQLQITGGGVVSDEELEQMLESGQTEVFVSNIMKDTRVTKQALNEIETRHDEILKLERSIQELHDMFTYLAIEVELQGEMIDRIEKNILDSEDYVKKGHVHLSSARESQKKARKKKFMIIICLSVAVVIVVIIIGVAITTG